MECFYHPATPAVGSCRSCLKGLCRACAAELDGGLACRGRCEAMVTAVVATLRQSARLQNVSGGLLRSAPGLWTGLTLVSGFVGLFVLVWGASLPAFREIALLSLPFFALAVIAGRLARSMRAADSGADGAEPSA